MNVVDKDEKMIGVLRLPQRLQENPLSIVSGGKLLPLDEALEFIVISEGSASERDDPDARLEQKSIWRSIGSPQHNFYNVLWIGRDKDGTAYRQGLGRVFKEAWDAEAGTENVEVMLK